MKKIILGVVLISLFFSCSQSRKWTDKEREEVREVVRQHREKSAIKHLAKENYNNLEDCIVATVEEDFPDYNNYTEAQSQSDTLVSIMVMCTSDIVGPSYENMALLFPYDQLQLAGILPANLTPNQLNTYYACLSSKIQGNFDSVYAFMYGILNDAAAGQLVSAMMQQCAVELAAQLGTQDQMVF